MGTKGHLILQNESTDRNWIGLQSDLNGNKLKKGAQACFCVDEVSNCQEFKPTPVGGLEGHNQSK